MRKTTKPAAKTRRAGGRRSAEAMPAVPESDQTAGLAAVEIAAAAQVEARPQPVADRGDIAEVASVGEISAAAAEAASAAASDAASGPAASARRKTTRRTKPAAARRGDPMPLPDALAPAPDMPVPPAAVVAPAAAAPLEPLIPALAVVPQLLLKAQGVKVAFFDVDGVLTDGGLFFSEAGETLKRFNTLDGHGIKLLAKAGITPAVVTGRDAPALRLRLAALGIRHVRYGTEDKRPAAESILEELALDWSQAAWIGDDWPDLPAMRRCQFACAPANAHAEVKALAHHVTDRQGGQGAAREFCDLLLVASGRYVELLQEYAA